MALLERLAAEKRPLPVAQIAGTMGVALD